MKEGLYAAVLVYEAPPEGTHDRPLYEESVVLLKARSDDDAQQKTLGYARAREYSYENASGDTIAWRLKHVVDVAPSTATEADLRTALDQGVEVHSRFFRDHDAYQAFEPLLSDGDL